MKLIKFTILLFVVLVSFQCKKNTNTKQKETITVKDVLGRMVKVPKNVTKVIGVNAGSMRFLSYFDAIPNVVGIEETERRSTRPYNLAFPEIKQIPVIGPQPGGDAELIMKANPDVIFITVPSAKQKVDDLQQKTGIPVVAIENGELGSENDKIYNTITIVGKVLGKNERATQLINFIQNEMDEIEKRTSTVAEENKPTVYAGGLSYNGSHGITSTRTDFTPFVLTNSKNVVAGLENGQLRNRPIMVDIEKIIEWNPDYIFIDSDGWNLAEKEMLPNTLLHNTLKAVKNGSVYIIPRYINNSVSYDYAIINSWYVAKTLYPEKFEDIDIDKKVKQILENFYLKDIDLNNFDIVYKQVLN
ncbi:iron ABC transporter substrate-binding protein [Gelatiniphilus marinus]|uniref:Iron ABC transporter substrate-binding protein n=1 Tax=Gelatiniphilus marinus TaxID=1759464 RepID=A0ABW5JVE2_9FLAO